VGLALSLTAIAYYFTCSGVHTQELLHQTAHLINLSSSEGSLHASEMFQLLVRILDATNRTIELLQQQIRAAATVRAQQHAHVGRGGACGVNAVGLGGLGIKERCFDAQSVH
jgi:hypothetical protein